MGACGVAEDARCDPQASSRNFDIETEVPNAHATHRNPGEEELTFRNTRDSNPPINKRKRYTADNDSSSDECAPLGVHNGPKESVDDPNDTLDSIDDVVITDLWTQTASCNLGRAPILRTDPGLKLHPGISYNPLPADRKILLSDANKFNGRKLSDSRTIKIRTPKIYDYEHEVDCGSVESDAEIPAEEIGPKAEPYVTPKPTYKTRTMISRDRKRREKIKLVAAAEKRKEIDKQVSCIDQIIKEVVEKVKYSKAIKSKPRNLGRFSSVSKFVAGCPSSLLITSQSSAIPATLADGMSLSSSITRTSNPIGDFIDGVVSKGLVDIGATKSRRSKLKRPLIGRSRRKITELYRHRDFSI